MADAPHTFEFYVMRVLVLILPVLLSACWEGPCTYDSRYNMHSVVLEFRDKSTDDDILPEDCGYTRFTLLERGYTEALRIDSIWECKHSEFGVGRGFDKVAVRLPLNLLDTISTFVIDGPGKTDTLQVIYHPMLLNDDRCGYQLLADDPVVSYTTLHVKWAHVDDCFLNVRMMVLQ